MSPPVSRRGLLAGTAAVAAAPALMGAAGAPRTENAEGRHRGGRLVEVTVDSPALGGPGEIALLTPRGWDRRRPGDRWPTLYLLPGGDGDHHVWTGEFAIQDIPELAEVLVVMPSMPLFGFCTDWWNHGAGGPPAVETFHLREVIPLMEREYGAGPVRALAGESQGGYGALSYASRHPGMFGAVAAFSSPVHPLAHPEVWLAGARLVGVDPLAIWGDPVAQRRNWIARDPYHHVRGLLGTPVYLSAGDGTRGEREGPDWEDEIFIPGTEEWIERLPDTVVSVTEAIIGRETRALTDRLISVGVQVEAHFHPGTHTGGYGPGELRRALPVLLGAL
ncbi:alpha/beta hydrolase [Streptomyces xiamenensis]|uniref:alpha/beta hydrolase n=1 Tax=Streptomyces xiamenensis TaxID=408015 RepID=UPI0036E2E0F0